MALLTFGHIGNYALEVCQRLKKENIRIGHYDMRFAKPLDERMLHDIFRRYDKIITVEDGCLQGGFGSAILEFMADNQYHALVRRLGIPDAIIEHGSQQQLQHECGFDAEGIEKTVRELILQPVRV